MAKHVGAECKNEGNICATMENGFLFAVVLPQDPTLDHGDAKNLVSRMERLIFEKEVDACVKRKALPSENI